MSKVRVPTAPLRPIVQEYIDGYETAEVEKYGNWHQALSPTVILADEADIPERSLRFLLAGTYDTIDFDRADRLFCAMGLGVLGWLQDDTLKGIYYSADLKRYEPEPEPQQLACARCATPFWPKRSGQKYCGKDCRQRAAWARDLKNYPPRECGWCGTEYQPKRSDSRYCSIRCINHGHYHQNGGAERQKERRARGA